MQKLIIVRGHSGSGKSTFAQAKIAEFKQQYLQAVCFHLENDFFIDQNGCYEWTPARFQQAKRQTEAAMQNALDYARQNPYQPVLIVLSNVGVNVAYIQRLRKQGEAQGMVVEIYRMQNFFPNRHQVAEYQVWQMYLALQQNPIVGEIFVPPIQPISDKIEQEIKKMQPKRSKKENKRSNPRKFYQ